VSQLCKETILSFPSTPRHFGNDTSRNYPLGNFRDPFFVATVRWVYGMTWRSQVQVQIQGQGQGKAAVDDDTSFFIVPYVPRRGSICITVQSVIFALSAYFKFFSL
jgi:hypothetical protein